MRPHKKLSSLSLIHKTIVQGEQKVTVHLCNRDYFDGFLVMCISALCLVTKLSCLPVVSHVFVCLPALYSRSVIFRFYWRKIFVLKQYLSLPPALFQKWFFHSQSTNWLIEQFSDHKANLQNKLRKNSPLNSRISSCHIAML